MPIHLIEENSGKLLVVHVSEKIASEDYKHFVSKFERLVTQTRETGRDIRCDSFPRLGRSGFLR
jgi:uncharacterized protein (UPF0335 family)